MQFLVVINQKDLANTSLDIIDAAILHYLYRYCNSPSNKVRAMRRKEHTWIRLDNILEELPLLRIRTKSSLCPRLDKLEKEGFISTFSSPSNRLFVKTLKKTQLLFKETNESVRKNEHYPCTNTNINNIDSVQEKEQRDQTKVVSQLNAIRERFGW